MVETIADNPRSVDAPRARGALRSQLTLVVTAAVGLGFVLGRLDTSSSAGFAVAAAVLLSAWTAAVGLAWAWIARPIRCFAQQLDDLTCSRRQVQVRALPTERDDEVGRMATAVRSLIIDRIRDHHDARQLRRTLDDRISRATDRVVNDLNKLAMRDALTDLGNRRYLDNRLPELVETARHTGTDLLCVMIDLDNFKGVNDTLGHGTGDELLVLLADLLKSAVRADDLAIRFGGDEFVLFLPGASLDRADQLTHHVRQLFRQRAAVLLCQKNLEVNLSVGAASLQKEGCQDGDELMERADRHLYRAKRSGKGCTCSLLGCTAA